MKIFHSIRTKVWLCVNVAFFGFLIATAFTFSANSHLSANISHLRDVDFPLGFKASELLHLYKEQQEQYQDGYLTGNLEAVDNANQLGEKILHEIKDMQRFRRQDVEEHQVELDLFRHLERKYRLFQQQASWLYASLATGEEPTLLLKEIRNVGQLQSELLNDIETARNLIEGAIIQETTQYQQFAQNNNIFQISLFIGVLVFASFVVNLAAKQMLLSPLNQIRQMVTDYGSRMGRSASYSVLESASEFGGLARAFRHMTLELDRTTFSKQYVDNILSHMLDVLIVLDPGLTIVKVNQATLDLLEYEEPDLIGRSVNDVVSGHLFNNPADYDLNLAHNPQGSLLINVEKDLIAQNGRLIPVILSLSLLDDDGNGPGMVCVARDITELKESRRQLEQSFSFLENVFESIPHPLYVVEACNFQVSYANSTARRKVDARNIACHLLLHNRLSPCQQYGEACPLSRVLETKRPVTVEHQIGKKTYELHGYPIFDSRGEVAQMIEYAVDITSRKTAEEELANFATRLQESNQELSDFAHVASHDLQEPLRKVLTFGSRLQDKYADRLDDKGLDYLARMQNAAQRMQTLINDLLDFSRVSTKAQPFVPISLESLVHEVLTDLEVRIEDLQGKVICGALPDIEADALQLRQLFQNLIGNALKFHRPGIAPVVYIESEITADPWDGVEFCRIIVKDNGIGIEPQYLDRIFGLFQRLHSRSEYEGSGIGLAICRKIVLRHHGSIDVHSIDGQGTEFIIVLPVRQIPVDFVVGQGSVDYGNHRDGLHPGRDTGRALS